MGAPLPADLPRYLTVDELAARIARNKFTVYHWVKRAPERLPRATNVLGRVLFLDSDVREWFLAERHAVDARRAAVLASARELPAAAANIPELAQPPRRRRGRPTKAEAAARRQAAAGGEQ